MVAGVGATLALAVAAAAEAQVRCGDTIGPNQQVVLQGDLECDDVEFALAVEGPAVLDLNGFAILCEDRNGDGREVIKGIVLEGKGATLRNGDVSRCRAGVLVAGAGRHKVSDVSVAFASSDGFRLESDRNKVSGSSSFFAGVTGFSVRGVANVLSRNAATFDRVGFDARERNTLKKNVASGSEIAAFVVGSGGSTLTDNRALGTLVGFEVDGDGNRLVGNQAEDNTTGYFLGPFAEDNVLTRCSATESAFNGFAVAGDRNKLRRSRAEANAANGIRLSSTAGGTVVTGTVAFGNGKPDLFDNTPGCGTNVWRGNDFGSSNDPCIR